jgi:hypothetical protein
MISDSADEDAVFLDDDALIEAYLRPEHIRTETGFTSDIPDWPPVTEHRIDITIDAATLAWFKSRHPDWRREIGFVVRAWVATQSAPGESMPGRSTSGTRLLTASDESPPAVTQD